MSAHPIDRCIQRAEAWGILGWLWDVLQGKKAEDLCLWGAPMTGKTEFLEDLTELGSIDRFDGSFWLTKGGTRIMESNHPVTKVGRFTFRCVKVEAVL